MAEIKVIYITQFNDDLWMNEWYYNQLNLNYQIFWFILVNDLWLNTICCFYGIFFVVQFLIWQHHHQQHFENWCQFYFKVDEYLMIILFLYNNNNNNKPSFVVGGILCLYKILPVCLATTTNIIIIIWMVKIEIFNFVWRQIVAK